MAKTKLILESAYINESIGFNGKSIEELRKEDPKVIRFIVSLQTTDVVNRNGRYYPTKVITGGMDHPRIQDIMKRNCFFIETGHPDSSDIKRQQRVEENNACGILKKYWMEGNKVKGLVETTADRKGTDWKNKILWNGLIPAFSLRATGDYHWDRSIKANVIDDPLTIFTYDSVQYPSHEGSVMERLTEEALSSIPINGKYNTAKIFNEGMIIDIPNNINEADPIVNRKKVHNLTESHAKKVKLGHEMYAYNPNDKVTFNEDMTVTVDREYLIKTVSVHDYIRKDISYNIYDFLNGKK